MNWELIGTVFALAVIAMVALLFAVGIAEGVKGTRHKRELEMEALHQRGEREAHREEMERLAAEWKKDAGL